MSILSTNKRLIKVGTEYSAGSGISIDEGVISVTGEFGKTYSAGDNISIYEQDEQLYISSKDWSDDIANASANAYEAATAQIPDPFDPTFISGQVDNKLDTTAFTAWQSGQYATDLQTIEGQINNKLDTSSFSDVSGSFLTAINIPESATWNEVSQAYEQASGTYLTSISIPESATWNEVSTTVQTNSAQWGQGGTGGDEEVNSFVYNNSADILDVDTTYQENSASYITAHQDVSNKLDTTAFSTVSGDFLTAAPADMATTGDVADLAQSVSETYQVKGDYLTTADSANFYPANNPSSFVDEDWVTAQGYITGVDLSEYAKRDFVLSSIESATSGKLDVSSFASVSGDFLTTSFEIPQSANWEEATTAYEQNSGTYLTSHQSLEGYATEQWVGEQGYLTEVSIPESGNWNEATTTVQTNSSTWNNVTNKLDTTAFSDVSSTFLTAVDLTPYQTIEGMTAYQPVGDYYTTAEAETLSSMLSAAIDYVSANAGDEFPVSADEAIQYVQTNSANIDDTVTSYQTNSGTFLNESNLEYNAVGEISGYGNSAIAQYGAEKQWLTHDDTIVHVSNSAQYAFGCNISALQRLMGIDETVLFSGEASTAITLSESPLNFNKIRVYTRVSANVDGNQNFGCGSYSEFLPYTDFNCALITGMFAGTSGSEANIYNVATKWTGTSGKNWSRTFYGFRAYTATGGYSTAGNWISPYVIVGIGRKEV